MKRFSRIFVMIFAFVAIMAFGVDVVSAASAPQTLLTGDSSYAGQYIGDTYFETKTLSTGGYAYCLNIHKRTTKNVQISRSKKMDNGFAYIIKNGYPSKSITGDKSKDYYLTQMAVWLYQDETGQNDAGSSRNLSANFRTNFANNDLAKKVIALVDGALSERNKAVSCKGVALSTKVDDNNLYLSKSKKYYVSKAVTVTSAASYAVSFVSAPEGTFAANSNGEKKSTFTKGETFNVYVPVEKVSVGTTNFSVKISSDYTVKCTSSVVYEYKPENSNIQSVIPAVLYDNDEENYKEDTSLNFTVTVKKVEEDKAKVKVIKVDATTGKGLAGAVLELQDKDGNVIDSWTSDGDYHAVEINIDKIGWTTAACVTSKEEANLHGGGVYGCSKATLYVVEKSAPKGYTFDPNNNKWPVEFIKGEVEEATITVENTKEEKRIVYIDKVDKETRQRIAGAVLVVRDSEGNVVVEFTTSDTVYVLDDIEDGTYTVEEKEAPAGYVKSDEIITITVDDKNVSQTITFENVKMVTDIPDTASNASIIAMIVGVIVIGSGLGYVVYTSKKQK